MAANNQEIHTLPPLPKGARVISEKDGKRISVFNGVVSVQISRERAAKQEPPMEEEAKEILQRARPTLKRRDDPPGPSVLSRPQPEPGPPGKIPGGVYRNRDSRNSSDPTA